MHKFTVVIPTRERADTLYWTLKSCIDQDYDNYEILVSDNCSIDNTKDVVESFKDPRIRYVCTQKRISMTHNWEFALSHVQEGYVSFIGDDDAFLPDSIVKITQLIDNYKVDSIAWNSHNYNWPNFIVPELNGKLRILLNDTFEILKTKDCLIKSLKSFQYRRLPNLYYGCVNIEIIKRIKLKHVSFFNSLTPDIYSAIILASEINTHIFSAFPFTICGVSKKSTGTAFFIEEQEKKQDKTINMLEEDCIPVHPKFVIAASYSIAFAEAYYQAKERAKNLSDLPMKKIIKNVFEDILRTKQYSIKTSDEILKVLYFIAQKNNELKFYNKLKQKYISIEVKREVFGKDSGYNPGFQILVINLEKLNITNVYDAAKVVGQIWYKFPVQGKYNQIYESLIVYFKRGFYYLVKKIIFKMGNIFNHI